jgi:hypothetical protein
MGESDPEGLDELSGSVRSNIDDLIWLGHLEEEFEFAGHTFVLRTLKADEELLSATLTKEYIDTLGQAKAWAWANVALALVAVDGDEDWCPEIGPSKKANARGKFNYCIQNWYWPLGEYLFYEYTQLVARQIEAIAEVRNLSTGSPQASTPSADSLTEQGDSENTEETPAIPIEEYLDKD